jgi:hypothetical protein
MARGVRFGSKPKLTPHQIAEARKRREAGEALSDIGRSFNVSHSTIFEALNGWPWNREPSQEFPEGSACLRGPYMLWNLAVVLTIIVSFGSVLFALWTDREDIPTERSRVQLDR